MKKSGTSFTNTSRIASSVAKTRLANNKHSKTRARKVTQLRAQKQVRTRAQLTPRQKRSIQALATRFSTWCESRLQTAPTTYSRTIHFPPPSAEDWIIRVSHGRVEINTHLAKRCTFDAFVVICIHELAHVFVQGIPNKIDAQQVKDSHGDPFMVCFDIQADMLAAEFMRTIYPLDIFAMLGIYFDSGPLFADDQIRNWKLERFLGTVLTLINAWMMEPPTQGGAPYPIIVPSIASVLTDDVLRLIEVRPVANRKIDVEISLDEFKLIKMCYTQQGITRDEYVQGLLTLCVRLLARAGRQTTVRIPKSLPRPASATELIRRMVGDWASRQSILQADSDIIEFNDEPMSIEDLEDDYHRRGG